MVFCVWLSRIEPEKNGNVNFALNINTNITAITIITALL